MEKIPETNIVGDVQEEYKNRVKELLEKRFLAQDELLFEGKKITDYEIIKTPEQISIINFINQETNRLMIESNAEPFDVPIENIHILSSSAIKEITDSKFPAYIPNKQAIIIPDSYVSSLLKFSCVIFHEILHMKGKQVWEVYEKNDDKCYIFREYRSGVVTHSIIKKDKDNLEHSHFKGLNEAIVSTQTMLSFPSLLELPENFEERERYYSEDEENKRKKIFEGHGISEDEIFFMDSNGNPIFGAGYPNVRRVLDFVCDEIRKEFPNDYSDMESVFKEFLRAHFTGNLLDIARLVEKTFGKGSFRILGMMEPKNVELINSVFELLQKKRRLV
jgi:hypothetical protein